MVRKASAFSDEEIAFDGKIGVGAWGFLRTRRGLFIGDLISLIAGH